jgi:prophage regulatory protein
LWAIDVGVLRMNTASEGASLPEMLLSVKDVAELLSISRRSVWRYVKRGKLPRPLYLSRRLLRWRASDVQRYLDSLPQQNG